MPEPPLVLRGPEVFRLLQISSALFYRLVREGEFPKPIKIGRASRWRRADVERWLSDRAAPDNRN